jgi:hypothetical protein
MELSLLREWHWIRIPQAVNCNAQLRYALQDLFNMRFNQEEGEAFIDQFLGPRPVVTDFRV